MEKTIAVPHLRAVVSNQGARLFTLQVEIGDRWVDLGQPHSDPADPFSCAGFCMLPLNNREADGKIPLGHRSFDFEHPIHPTDALHSIGVYVPWQMVATSSAANLALHFPGSAHGFRYPAPFDARVAFGMHTQLPEIIALGREPKKFAALSINIGLTSPGGALFPAGAGFHPMLLAFPGGITRPPTVRYHVTAKYPRLPGRNYPEAKAGPLPPQDDRRTEGPLPVGLDDCFSGWSRHAWLTYAELGIRLHIVAIDHFTRHLQVWVPGEEGVPSGVFALEPQTTCPNACNLTPKLGVEVTGLQFVGRGGIDQLATEHWLIVEWL